MGTEQITQIERYIGLSTDTKPTSAPPGSTYKEINTGKMFVFQGGSWHQDPPEVGGGDA